MLDTRPTDLILLDFIILIMFDNCRKLTYPIFFSLLLLASHVIGLITFTVPTFVLKIQFTKLRLGITICLIAFSLYFLTFRVVREKSSFTLGLTQLV
jgi:hypothetical protein